MLSSQLILLFVATLFQQATTSPISRDAAIVVPETLDDSAGPVLPKSYLSYSFEFAFFPDFAGNASSPNSFTKNLLASITDIQGSAPVIRVGGNTQDKTIFALNQTQAIVSVYDDAVSRDYPAKSWIGPTFFESYANMENTTFIHGFNFAAGGNCSTCIDDVVEHAKVACKALGNSALAYEYGNEPDIYGVLQERPTGWNEQAVYPNWREGKEKLSATIQEHCPESAHSLRYIAPSFANPFEFMDPIKAWQAGFNNESDLYAFAQHNYVGVSTDPGLTLRSSLLNHSYTTASMTKVSRIMAGLSLPSDTPFMLTETNSLARQGLPLVSDTFGAALWNVDFALQAASIGVQRVNMHQGVNYRYGSWQPIETNRSVKATKPAFYGNVATADFVGRAAGELRVMELDLKNEKAVEEQAAYVGFVDGKVERLAVVNLRQWNSTDKNERPEQQYEFQTSGGVKEGRVKRLIADGSDAYSGVTYGGFSYNFELDNGKPVRLDNVTDVEIVPVSDDGKLRITIPASSAVVVKLV